MSLTSAAQRSREATHQHLDAVASWSDLAHAGITWQQTNARLAAGRWTRFGKAIVLHNAAPTREQAELIALINCGPRAVLTSFSAARRWGLEGWERDEIHVLAPAGTARPQISGLRLHRVRDWEQVETAYGRRLHRLGSAVLLAASSFASPRSACGILAAGVQQRLLTANDLLTAISAAPRLRHRATLLHAVADIGQGADALSEIDFVRLCRRAGLPVPRRQAVRIERSGRRRYLDVEWELRDGRVVAVEVDGAIHLKPKRWYSDQLRQNEVVIGGTILLRYPSVVVRTEEAIVVDQLTRILAIGDAQTVS